jgi:predicted RNA-binding protein Jag
MAIDIGTFAEKRALDGDLADRLKNKQIAKDGSSLTKADRAWANSFSQQIIDLASYSSEKLTILLAEDYNERFNQKLKKPAAKIAKAVNKKNK